MNLLYVSTSSRFSRTQQLLVYILLCMACDDSNTSTNVLDDAILDQSISADGSVDLGLVEDATVELDQSVDQTLPACTEVIQPQINESAEGVILQNDLGPIAALDWPANSLNLMTMTDGEVTTQPPPQDQWPEIEFKCEDLALNSESSLHVSQVISVKPILRDDTQYWSWQHPALLTLTLPKVMFDEHPPLNQLELWWWPYHPSLSEEMDANETIQPPKRLMLRNPKWDGATQTLTLTIDEWGTYVVTKRIAASAEQPEAPFSYRALIGVSMGGGGSAHIGTRAPNLFDFIAALGGPSDWVYMLHYVTDRLLSGFCSGERLGEFCGNNPNTQPFEQYSDFLNFIYTENGAVFDRDFYIKVFQDVVLALGNPTVYHPDSPYLPPGIPLEELMRSRRDRCRTECRGDDCDPPEEWLKLDNFYDDDFNPDGSYDVIPICDGEVGDGEPSVWADLPHNKPTELFLAVDLNSNGRRDRNEPIIINTSEPYDDVGCDGLRDADEPGYHPLFNPDPNGDNFHWLYHPFGTENDRLFQGANGDIGLNFVAPLPSAILNPERNPISVIKRVLEHYACQDDEPGEPFRDDGLDGVPLTPSIAEGGFDWGEGNGQFDYNPHKINFITANPAFWLIDAFSNPAVKKTRFWIDGGIRDVMNFAVASMHLAGRLHAISPEPVTLYDNFKPLLGVDLYLPGRAPVEPLNLVGQHVLFRYGDPNATAEAIEDGDGAHVGTDAQAAGRVNGAMHWIASAWHERLGEQAPAGSSVSEVISDSVESDRFGGRYHFEVITPPGYKDEANQGRRYPVVYFLHGYGQKARYLTSTNIIFSSLISAGTWPPIIFVYPDGACSDMIHRACNDSVDNDDDGLIDLDDPGCQGDERRRVEDDDPMESSPPRCRDGVDNDRDGLTDLDDPGCLNAEHDDEGECREGTFFLNHLVNVDGVSRGRDYEAAFIDMVHYVDEKYRTLSPNE
jgi:hypothetical protein